MLFGARGLRMLRRVQIAAELVRPAPSAPRPTSNVQRPTSNVQPVPSERRPRHEVHLHRPLSEQISIMHRRHESKPEAIG
jgi:hypothetical protein